MRNPNGYGSVYKLSGKRRKPYAVAKTLSLDTGVQKRVVLGYFESKKDANIFLADYNKNPYKIDEKKITFYDVYQLFLEASEKRVGSKTLTNYKNNIKTFKSIYDKPIVDIKLYDLQLIFDNSENSFGTLTTKKVFCKLVFNYAYKREIVSKNYAELIEINKKNETVFKRKIFNKNEVNVLWDKKDTFNKKHSQTLDMVLVMIYSGLRIGELINLKIEDIEILGDKKVFHVKESKTKAGIRLIPINHKILPIIYKYMKSDKIYLFETPTNKQIDYRIFRRNNFNLLMDLLEFKHTIHDCRHTFATLMNSSNANKSAVKNLIGHTDINLTEKVYTHLEIEELERAINLI